jgi:hypothetical protein
MKLGDHRRLLWMGAAVLAVTTAALASAAQGSTRAAGFTPFASGLANPRGLTFGPDGDLYVAEGGDPDGNSLRTDTPTLLCDQAGNVGPYRGGLTSRISKIDQDGNRTTVVDGLPSSSTTPESGRLTSGVADVSSSTASSTASTQAPAARTASRTRTTPSSGWTARPRPRSPT